MKTLSHVGTVGPTLMALAGREGRPQLQGARVPAALFHMLRTTPLHGRLLEPTDEAPDAERVVSSVTEPGSGTSTERPTSWGAPSRWRRSRCAPPEQLHIERRDAKGLRVPRQSDPLLDGPHPVTTPNSARARAPLIGRLADGISPEAASDEVGSILRHMRSDDAPARMRRTRSPLSKTAWWSR